MRLNKAQENSTVNDCQGNFSIYQFELSLNITLNIGQKKSKINIKKIEFMKSRNKNIY